MPARTAPSAPKRGLMAGWRRVGWLAITIAMSGCIEHRGEIQRPADDGNGDWQLVVDDQINPEGPLIYTNHLPIERQVTLWRRRPDGTLERGDQHLATPLAWWQRFPADIFADFSFRTNRAAATLTPTATVIAPISEQELTARAERFGYAGNRNNDAVREEPDDASRP